MCERKRYGEKECVSEREREREGERERERGGEKEGEREREGYRALVNQNVRLCFSTGCHAACLPSAC